MHKTWKPAEEKALIEEFKKAGCNSSAIPALAKRFNRSKDSVWKKLERLGLNVGGAKIQVSSSFERVKNLPSLEEVLKIVAGALEKATEPGLGKVELQRLDTIATLYKAYEAGLEKYVKFAEIEQRLMELETKYAKLAKERTTGNKTASPT